MILQTNESNNLACTDADILEGLGGTKDGITVESIKKTIKSSGIICSSDPRVVDVFKSLDAADTGAPLTKEQFFEAASGNLTFLHRIATRELIISDFSTFTNHLDLLKNLVQPNNLGNNADYIPILRDAPSDRFGVAFCSVDGQFYECGDSRDAFSIQSTSKPLTFALALEMLGAEKVLEWIGIEPSGRPFNDMALLNDSRPYNPMVNSGALMTAAMLASAYPELLRKDKPNEDNGTYAQELSEEILIPLWRRLSGNGIVGDIGFSEETFLSERETADTNIGIAYTMKARKGLPPLVSTNSMIDFYLRACSLTANTASMAVVAATLANGGRNPITGDQIFSADVVKKTLSVLSFCGFYDNAGEFFFHTGIPSKSGVSGVVFLVLPNIGGFAIFSPRLDKYGNSVRGSAFSKKLVEMFTFHSFDSISSFSNGCKLDPRFSCDFSRQRSISRLRWAAKAGGRRAERFDEILLDVCVRVALVDGNVDHDEIVELKRVYKTLMSADLPQSRLDEKIENMPKKTGQNALESLFDLVSAEEPKLDDIEKQLLIEATVQITTADGTIASQEREILITLARALQIDPVIIELHLKAWEKKLETK